VARLCKQCGQGFDVVVGRRGGRPREYCYDCVPAGFEAVRLPHRVKLRRVTPLGRDTQQVSVAARSLAARRWGSSRPIRLAQELALRAAELPEVERWQLLKALDLVDGVNVTELISTTGAQPDRRSAQ
jgi:hypothetical protein